MLCLFFYRLFRRIYEKTGRKLLFPAASLLLSLREWGEQPGKLRSPGRFGKMRKPAGSLSFPAASLLFSLREWGEQPGKLRSPGSSAVRGVSGK